jgi:hypothetical protein
MSLAISWSERMEWRQLRFSGGAAAHWRVWFLPAVATSFFSDNGVSVPKSALERRSMLIAHLVDCVFWETHVAFSVVLFPVSRR